MKKFMLVLTILLVFLVTGNYAAGWLGSKTKQSLDAGPLFAQAKEEGLTPDVLKAGLEKQITKLPGNREYPFTYQVIDYSVLNTFVKQKDGEILYCHDIVAKWIIAELTRDTNIDNYTEVHYRGIFLGWRDSTGVLCREDPTKRLPRTFGFKGIVKMALRNGVWYVVEI